MEPDASRGTAAPRPRRRAGGRAGTQYQYLPDKEAIVEALAGRYLAEFEGLMTALAEEASAPMRAASRR